MDSFRLTRQQFSIENITTYTRDHQLCDMHDIELSMEEIDRSHQDLLQYLGPEAGVDYFEMDRRLAY